MVENINFHTGKKKPVEGNEFIFPILKGTNPKDLTCIGTGFFIGTTGIFATAAHVLEDVLDDKGNPQSALIAFCFLPPNKYLIRHIRKGTIHQQADVAVGAVETLFYKKTNSPLKNKVVRLTPLIPKVGEKIVTWAYPKTKILKDVTSTKVMLKPKFYTGKIIQEFPEGKPGKIKGPCYFSDLGIESGTSGGPVFDSSSNVFAINSGGYNQEISIASHIQKIGGLIIPDVITETGKIHEEITISELIKMKNISSYPPLKKD